MAGSRKWIERPKSPCTTWARNTAYCTGSGRSVPSSFATRAYSLRGASAGSSSGTGSPDNRMTMKTTVETSQTATRARMKRAARKATTARMDKAGRSANAPAGRRLGAAELEGEAANLQRLVGIRGPVHVLLQTVILVRLDDRNPRQVLEEDLRH